MAEKQKFAVVTFHTTTEAMQMESTAKEAGFSGRLIPVPRVISAGCGLAWRENIDNRDELEAFMKAQNIECDSIHELDL